MHIDEPIEIITGLTKYPAPFTHRVLILCHEKNIPYVITNINTEKKPKWFLKIAPIGLIPVIRIGNNTIFDSHAICEYLDSITPPPILPVNKLECGIHRSWMCFADDLAYEIAQFVKQGNMLNHDLSRMHELFTILDSQIKNPYFFGYDFSMVDISLISHILWIDALEQKYRILSKS